MVGSLPAALVGALLLGCRASPPVELVAPLPEGDTIARSGDSGVSVEQHGDRLVVLCEGRELHSTLPDADPVTVSLFDWGGPVLHASGGSPGSGDDPTEASTELYAIDCEGGRLIRLGGHDGVFASVRDRELLSYSSRAFGPFVPAEGDSAPWVAVRHTELRQGTAQRWTWALRRVGDGLALAPDLEAEAERLADSFDNRALLDEALSAALGSGTSALRELPLDAVSMRSHPGPAMEEQPVRYGLPPMLARPSLVLAWTPDSPQDTHGVLHLVTVRRGPAQVEVLERWRIGAHTRTLDGLPPCARSRLEYLGVGDWSETGPDRAIVVGRRDPLEAGPRQQLTLLRWREGRFAAGGAGTLAWDPCREEPAVLRGRGDEAPALLPRWVTRPSAGFLAAAPWGESAVLSPGDGARLDAWRDVAQGRTWASGPDANRVQEVVFDGQLDGWLAGRHRQVAVGLDGDGRQVVPAIWLISDEGGLRVFAGRRDLVPVAGSDGRSFRVTDVRACRPKTWSLAAAASAARGGRAADVESTSRVWEEGCRSVAATWPDHCDDAVGSKAHLDALADLLAVVLEARRARVLDRADVHLLPDLEWFDQAGWKEAASLRSSLSFVVLGTFALDRMEGVEIVAAIASEGPDGFEVEIDLLARQMPPTDE